MQWPLPWLKASLAYLGNTGDTIGCTESESRKIARHGQVIAFFLLLLKG